LLLLLLLFVVVVCCCQFSWLRPVPSSSVPMEARVLLGRRLSDAADKEGRASLGNRLDNFALKTQSPRQALPTLLAAHGEDSRKVKVRSPRQPRGNKQVEEESAVPKEPAPQVPRSPSKRTFQGRDRGHNGTAIIIDWDDTLLPTTFITGKVWPTLPFQRRCQKLPRDSPSFEALAQHARKVRQLLITARSHGHVSIVTLSKRPWVTRSAEWYLPGMDLVNLLDELQIDVYYAREHVTASETYLAATEGGVDLQVIAKRNAMSKFLRKLTIHERKSNIRNVISIGDSMVEHEAIKEYLWASDSYVELQRKWDKLTMPNPTRADAALQLLCKTVLLKANPTLEQLSTQLEILFENFRGMAFYEDDFDILTRNVEDLERQVQDLLAEKLVEETL